VIRPETRYARSGDVNIAFQVGEMGLRFEEHGIHELKGVPGRWPLYAVERGRTS
jgi:class 3 adenylate cyclase